VLDAHGNPVLDGNGNPVPSVLLGLMGAESNLSSTISPLQTDLGTLQALSANPGGDPALLTLLGTDATFATAFGNVVTHLATDAVPAGIFPVGHPLHNGGILVQVDAGLQQIIGGLQLIAAHLDSGTGPNPDPTGVTDPVGISGGLKQLLDPKKGLPAAVAGINKLYAGAGQAFVGSKKLLAGSGAALDGSQQLTTGSGDALAGSKDLASGLGKLSAGQHQVATGLPAAVDGTAQLAGGISQVLDGAKKVKDGIGQVQTGATGPLTSQLNTASQNGHKQLAVLAAASGLASSGPGGAGASYVLTQSTRNFSLAADTQAGGGSHTARNVGIGVGGLVLLVVGLGGGFALGRQGRRHTA
jgi:putative membrane protein